MAADFRESAYLMAKQLETMKRLQQQHRDMGDTEVDPELRAVITQVVPPQPRDWPEFLPRLEMP
jgi:hypothetical protein